jgi:hypothetical protein
MKKVIAMSEVLSVRSAFEAKASRVELSPARRLLRAVLLRVAARAAQLAARVEKSEAPAQQRPASREAFYPCAGARAAGAGVVEAAVLVAVAAYFVAGVVGVLVT